MNVYIRFTGYWVDVVLFGTVDIAPVLRENVKEQGKYVKER